MSCRVDTSPLISGACVVGDTGHGVLGSEVPSTGTHGAGYLYNDLSLPADASKEVCGFITTFPVGLTTFFAYEDSSFIATGPDGSYYFDYLVRVDGVDSTTDIGYGPGIARCTFGIGATESAITAAAGVATTSTLAGSSTAAAAITAASGAATASTLAGSSSAVSAFSAGAGVATASSLAGTSTAVAAFSSAAGVATTSTMSGAVGASSITAAAGVATTSTMTGSSVAAAAFTAADGVATASTMTGAIGSSAIDPASGMAVCSVLAGSSIAVAAFTPAAGVATCSTMVDGNATIIPTMPPYITVYMWRRTA